MRVHIDGNREYSVDELGPLAPSEYSTVGEWADAIALANTVGGSDGETCQFSFKVDGTVAKRSTKIGRLKDGALLELVDVSEYEPSKAAVAQATELSEGAGAAAAPELHVDPEEVPDATIDTVLDWVGDDDDRRAKALEVELAKGDDARSTLVEALTPDPA